MTSIINDASSADHRVPFSGRWVVEGFHDDSGKDPDHWDVVFQPDALSLRREERHPFLTRDWAYFAGRQFVQMDEILKKTRSESVGFLTLSNADLWRDVTISSSMSIGCSSFTIQDGAAGDGTVEVLFHKSRLRLGPVMWLLRRFMVSAFGVRPVFAEEDQASSLTCLFFMNPRTTSMDDLARGVFSGLFLAAIYPISGHLLWAPPVAYISGFIAALVFSVMQLSAPAVIRFLKR